MTRKRRTRHPWIAPIAVTALFAVGLFAPTVWGTVTATSKIDAPVSAQLESAPVASIDVVLGFPPDRYNISTLQSYGTIQSVNDESITMVGITSENVRLIANHYWVQEIAPIGEGS